MSQVTFEAIKSLLDKNGVNYSIMHHAAVITSEEAAKVRGRGIEEGMKRGAKALILRSEGRFFQFVLPGFVQLDMNKIRSLLNTKSLSFASKDEVISLSDCIPGSVPPFGILWNIPVYADRRLSEEIDFNAGLHEVSITMSLSDWKRIVNPIVVDLV